MSLLIKALATAEKDKQAELKKKRAAEPAADVASPLALESLSAAGETGSAEESELNSPLMSRMAEIYHCLMSLGWLHQTLL